MYMRIPPLTSKILLGSNPLNSRILLRRLARREKTTLGRLVLYTTTQWGCCIEGACLNSGTFAVSEIASRRWWCLESFFPFRSSTNDHIIIITITTSLVLLLLLLLLLLSLLLLLLLSLLLLLVVLLLDAPAELAHHPRRGSCS